MIKVWVSVVKARGKTFSDGDYGYMSFKYLVDATLACSAFVPVVCLSSEPLSYTIHDRLDKPPTKGRNTLNGWQLRVNDENKWVRQEGTEDPWPYDVSF
jgi:hypothetical protein